MALVVSLKHKKDKKNISENKKKIIEIKQIQGESGGGKTWSKRSNNKGKTNKSQKQQQRNNKANRNGDTKRKNGVHLVDGKWIWICNKGCGFIN